MADSQIEKLDQTKSAIPVGRTQHIWCSVSITKKMEDVFTRFILTQAQNNEKISEYIVYLSTTGGNPFAAISLYNFIKSISQKTTVFNMGNVSSAGVPFFLAFQNRFGVADCSFMVHQTTLPRTVFSENVNVFELDRQTASLASTDNKTQKIILKETTSKASKPLTASAIKNAFLKTATYDEKEALEVGFIEKVESPKIPNTPDVLFITDQYLATLPG
jgi:ATP-dependent protease ClpP protease subunit